MEAGYLSCIGTGTGAAWFYAQWYFSLRQGVQCHKEGEVCYLTCTGTGTGAVWLYTVTIYYTVGQVI